ncbi:hypothetical protein [Streptomyces sp. NPDC091219]
MKANADDPAEVESVGELTSGAEDNVVSSVRGIDEKPTDNP